MQHVREHKEKEPHLGLPFFIADKNLVEVWGIFIQDGVLHVQEEAPVNLNQVLHGKTKAPGDKGTHSSHFYFWATHHKGELTGMLMKTRLISVAEMNFFRGFKKY